MDTDRGEIARKVAETFGPDSIAFLMLAHLLARIDGFNEGDFRTGFEAAVQEGAAYLDDKAGDGGTQALTIMEQMCGLLAGDYSLIVTPRRPLGVVVTPPSPSASSGWEAGAAAMREAAAKWHDERSDAAKTAIDREDHEDAARAIRALPLPPAPPAGEE